MTAGDLRQVAQEWLAPLDATIADLWDKSETMTIGAFVTEVEAAIRDSAGLFDRLNRESLQTTLEDEIGAAIIRTLKR